MTKIEAEVIVGLAESNLNAAQTAKKMNCHKNTIRYHINRIKKETGSNPRNFSEMCKLLPMAEEILRSAPGVMTDVELVIRCKNCKYWLEDFGEVCSREEDWFYCAPDDFCSRGARRGEKDA